MKTNEGQVWDRGLPAASPSVALVCGGWGQNLGNAFFNLGGMHILRTVFGEKNVQFIQDQPAYRTFHNQKKGNPKNDFGILAKINIKYIVLQGPMLTSQFGDIWERTFQEYRRLGVKIILLSAGLFRYSDEEIQAVRRFLQKYPPALISTRDRKTFEIVKDLSEYVYSGIDSAFFLADCISPIELKSRKNYVALNFDRFPEPDIALLGEGHTHGCREADIVIPVLGHAWRLRSSRARHFLSKLGKWQAYVGWAFDFARRPSEISGVEIVRTEHRTNPFLGWKVYRQSNTVAWDDPYTYCSIYSGSALTLSDRVHACVATLAYGGEAMLFSPTPRGSLFERVGAEGIRKAPVRLDLHQLAKEKENEINFIRDAIKKINID